MEQERGRVVLDGVLDVERIEALAGSLRSLVEKGYVRIEVDCASVDGLFMEAVEAFSYQHSRSWAVQKGISFELIFLNMKEEVSVALQLARFTINRQSLRLTYPPGNDEGEGSGEGGIVLCLACEKPVHVRHPGLYGCPHCGSHFHIDGEGRTVFYELLREVPR